jgi:hypothetical protein
VRVQAYQVTMQTPGGCKKFELSAGKDLLEVGVERRRSRCPLHAESLLQPCLLLWPGEGGADVRPALY